MDQELLKSIIIKCLASLNPCSQPMVNPKAFPIGVSNRHVHLSQADLELLFGNGHSLHCQKDLSQPGQCAAAETVILAGPRGCIEQVRVLGPVRKQTQVEISISDTFKLGISAPVRESGNLEGSSKATIIGPKGSITINEGVIIAKRHIHMHPLDADCYGVHDGQIVQVKAGGERGVVFDNVVVRVSDKFSLEFHIDTDEANGAGIKNGEVSAFLLASKFTFEGAENIPSRNTIPKVKEEIRVLNLITEDVVRQAWKNNSGITANKGAICTPLAKDTLKELGVSIVWQ